MFGRRSAPEKPEDVLRKKQLGEYIQLLVNDLDNNPESWENVSLRDYLESIAAFLEDSGAGESAEKSMRVADVAGLFHAGKIYE